MPKFSCPACGFTVFNRRVATCESCKAALPANMRFSVDELARLEAEAARIDTIRLEMLLEAELAEAEKRKRRGDGG